MSKYDSAKRISLRVQNMVWNALEKQAKGLKYPISVTDHIQNILAQAAVISGEMIPDDQKQLQAQYNVFQLVSTIATELVSAGKFDENFTLLVFQQLMQNTRTRDVYETAIGGGAYIDKLPGKTPLNMQLGWHIKNVIGASVLKDESGNLQRASVRNEPIQSYTLLTLQECDKDA